MKKRNVLLVLGMAALALVLLVCGLSQRSSLPSLPTAEPQSAGEESISPSDTEEAVARFFAEYPAESYLLLTTSSGTHMPIPLNEDNSFRITQADGSENVVHIGKNSFYMESSNCENQNCVQQGEVDLENRDKRVLFNMVICLPHNIRLELVTRDEAQSFLTRMYEQEGVPGPEGG